LGGWTLSDEFSTAFATQSGRDRFVGDVVGLFKTYEFFSVVDFDWEYPGGGGDPGNASSSNDGANFALVLEQLRAELDALESQTGRNYEVSIATAGGSEKLANLNLSGIDPYVDFYNVMTYDFHGGWENQTGHQAAMTGDANNYDVTTAVSVFEGAGVELSKVVLGAPSYTRAWGGVEDGGSFGYQQSGTGAEAEGSFEAGVYDYKDIVRDVITGQTDLYWDDNSKAAFAYNGDEWSSIETTATIAGKAAYVQAKDLGGMMFWALSNDAEGDLSLVETADDILRQGVSYADAVGKAPEFDYVLGGNGEFSISDFTALA
jgi:chitinase